MSSSRIASTRFQSLLDGLFIFFPLFIVRPSQRNDADGVGYWLCERHESGATLNRANPNPSLLAIVLARVGPDKEGTAEHLLCPSEVEAMLPNVGAVLGFVPFEDHCNSKRSYIATSPVMPPLRDTRSVDPFSVTDVTVRDRSSRGPVYGPNAQ